jgi:hypothetical protein
MLLRFSSALLTAADPSAAYLRMGERSSNVGSDSG